MNEQRDFSAEAATWDDNPRRRALAEDIAGSIVYHIHLSSDMDALDFGCGTGLLATRLHAKLNSVTGVDSSEGMIEVLRRKIFIQGITNIRAELLNIDNGGEIPGQYHLVYSSMTMHHIEDTGRLIGRFWRALHPGGRVAVADLDLDGGLFHDDNTGVYHQGFSRIKLLSAFESAGFKSLGISTASVVNKPGADGVWRDFKIFLLTAQRPK